MRYTLVVTFLPTEAMLKRCCQASCHANSGVANLVSSLNLQTMKKWDFMEIQPIMCVYHDVYIYIWLIYIYICGIYIYG